MSADKEKVYRIFVLMACTLKDKDVAETVSKSTFDKFIKSRSEQAEDILASVYHVMFEMKIAALHEVGSDLEFSFYRGSRPPENGDSGDDGEWVSDLDRNAA